MKIKPCVPDKLPLSLSLERFTSLLDLAHEALDHLDEILRKNPHAEKLFSLLISQEALTSLGSQKVTLSLTELLEKEAFQDFSDSKDALQRIFYYRKAMLKILHTPRFVAISERFLCRLHGIVKKSKGEKSFRSQQNWIGPIGKGIEEAYFYPPDVPMLHKSWRNLTQYLHYKEKDPLIQLAVFFAQLLVLHPFMDGNGRVARILIPFFLYKKKLLSKPLFFSSRYFQKHRLQYFERLFAITKKRDWEGWVRFFLQGMIDEGTRMRKKMEAMSSLYQELLEELGATKKAEKKLLVLFSSPIMKKEEWVKAKKTYPPFQILEKRKEVISYKKEAMVKRLLAIAKKDH